MSQPADGEPCPCCQRTLARTAGALGLELRMAFEVEWYLATAGGGPAATGPAYGMTRVVEVSAYLRVSFAPVVSAGQVGNGHHRHVSARRDGQALFSAGAGPYGLRPAGEAAMAGLLRRLPALAALTAPGAASRLRLEPQRWAAPYRMPLQTGSQTWRKNARYRSCGDRDGLLANTRAVQPGPSAGGSADARATGPPGSGTVTSSGRTFPSTTVPTPEQPTVL